MNATSFRPVSSSIPLTEFTELVRGNEQKLLHCVRPLVAHGDVTLDFRSIARIDAAGLAVLITLYNEAAKAGHRFAITNLSPHVEEIIDLVGLNAFLEARSTEKIPCFSAQLQQTAA